MKKKKHLNFGGFGNKNWPEPPFSADNTDSEMAVVRFYKIIIYKLILFSIGQVKMTQNDGISTPAVKIMQGRLQSFGYEDGNFQIAVDSDLPQCLVNANTAIKSEKNDEARDILNEQAVEEIRQIIEKDPLRTDIMVITAKLFMDIELWQSAEEWYLKALEQEEHLLLYCELGSICEKLKRYTESIKYYQKAVELAPDDTRIWMRLAKNLANTGRIQEGVDLMKKAMKKTPELNDDFLKQSLLWYEHYLPDMDPKAISDECIQLAKVAAPMSLAKKSHDNDPDPDRKLRVGYISPDFYTHSVARSFEPFLDGHDRNVVEVYGYSSVHKPDEVTEKLSKKFDYFRDIMPMDRHDAAELIENDKIDILVEIGGYSQDNRLDVMIHKPAPIQVDYGGISTTGMEQIDYRFTDSILDTARMRKFYIEESVDLPGGLFCYKPPEITLPMSPVPAKKNGYVTFGTFNNNNKISPYIMKVWSEVLKANKNSRLIMKFHAGHDQGVKDYYFSEFEKLGIGPERLEIYGWLHHIDHMHLYGQIDLMLDTYPFNGCITTLEGLWMGIPVVTMTGKDTLLSRAGLSILSRIGLEIFSASTPNEFISKAVSFANQLDDLEKIRFSLRSLMINSSLCDPKGYVKGIEQAYRKMWHKWCKKQKSEVGSQRLVESSANAE